MVLSITATAGGSGNPTFCTPRWTALAWGSWCCFMLSLRQQGLSTAGNAVPRLSLPNGWDSKSGLGERQEGEKLNMQPVGFGPKREVVHRRLQGTQRTEQRAGLWRKSGERKGIWSVEEHTLLNGSKHISEGWKTVWRSKAGHILLLALCLQQLKSD